MCELPVCRAVKVARRFEWFSRLPQLLNRTLLTSRDALHSERGQRLALSSGRWWRCKDVPEGGAKTFRVGRNTWREPARHCCARWRYCMLAYNGAYTVPRELADPLPTVTRGMKRVVR